MTISGVFVSGTGNNGLNHHPHDNLDSRIFKRILYRVKYALYWVFTLSPALPHPPTRGHWTAHMQYLAVYSFLLSINLLFHSIKASLHVRCFHWHCQKKQNQKKKPHRRLLSLRGTKIKVVTILFNVQVSLKFGIKQFKIIAIKHTLNSHFSTAQTFLKN